MYIINIIIIVKCFLLGKCHFNTIFPAGCQIIAIPLLRCSIIWVCWYAVARMFWADAHWPRSKESSLYDILVFGYGSGPSINACLRDFLYLSPTVKKCDCLKKLQVEVLLLLLY